MLDGWDDGYVDDTVPWVGRTALVVSAVAIVAGALVVGAILTGVDYLWRATRGR